MHTLCWCPAVPAASGSPVGGPPAVAWFPGSASTARAGSQRWSPGASRGQRRVLSPRAFGAAARRSIRDPFLFSSVKVK